MGKNSLYEKGQRFYKSNSLIVYILSALLFCWITVIALNFNKNTIDVCDSLNQIQNVSSYATETTKLDSNILEYHNSRVNTGAFAVAIISTIITFLAFYIQYVFNKQQREDISKERKENQFFHLLDVYRDICSNSVVDNKIYGKKAFHYMFYEYKAIFNIINDDEILESNNLSIYEKNYLAFVFFINGITPNALPTYKNTKLSDESKIEILSRVRELLYKYRAAKNITYLMDYDNKDISFADGHRPILIPYIKYIYLIVEYIISCKMSENQRISYIKYLTAEMNDHEIGLIYAYKYYREYLHNESNMQQQSLQIDEEPFMNLFNYIFKDLPEDIGFKFRFNDKDFFNRTKIDM